MEYEILGMHNMSDCGKKFKLGNFDWTKIHIAFKCDNSYLVRILPKYRFHIFYAITTV